MIEALEGNFKPETKESETNRITKVNYVTKALSAMMLVCIPVHSQLWSGFFAFCYGAVDSVLRLWLPIEYWTSQCTIWHNNLLRRIPADMQIFFHGLFCFALVVLMANIKVLCYICLVIIITTQLIWHWENLIMLKSCPSNSKTHLQNISTILTGSLK